MKDAVAYQKLRQKKQGVVAKTKDARPMVKPGAKKVEDGTKKKAERARQKCVNRITKRRGQFSCLKTERKRHGRYS